MSDRSCRDCGETKPDDAFVRTQGRLTTLCRACNVSRVQAWREANPAKDRAARARYRDKHRDARRAAALDRYYRIMATDPDRLRSQRREWAKTPRGRMVNRLGAHRRRGVTYDADAREWVEVVLRDPCSYCTRPAAEVDHITPVSHGGDGRWSNLTGSCRSCNARKNDGSLLSSLAASLAGAAPAFPAPAGELVEVS